MLSEALKDSLDDPLDLGEPSCMQSRLIVPGMLVGNSSSAQIAGPSSAAGTSNISMMDM